MQWQKPLYVIFWATEREPCFVYKCERFWGTSDMRQVVVLWVYIVFGASEMMSP